jgi:hypothetical protein
MILAIFGDFRVFDMTFIVIISAKFNKWIELKPYALISQQYLIFIFVYFYCTRDQHGRP